MATREELDAMSEIIGCAEAFINAYATSPIPGLHDSNLDYIKESLRIAKNKHDRECDEYINEKGKQDNPRRTP